ncbi:phytanoyl-CoA dioxygenase family protein [Roseibium aggregatum]|uniref:phytanoyl-CoA dioxygenase family protein n=1 Tax=Roseibium aggregatum TaxID=187304 RepID=UPI0025AC1B2E|nr:phytanoyl-CoA dioxygenase family protein [Roseibium aggregatum]WJS05548.1 phytanoyl-CoA dioxygenase family protein [Roseibium aggregatum]
MTPDVWELQGWCIADAAACEAHISALALAEAANSIEYIPEGWHQPGASHRGNLAQVILDAPAEVMFCAGPAGSTAGTWQVVPAGQTILLDARYWMRLRNAERARIRIWRTKHAAAMPPVNDLVLWRQQGFTFLRGGLSADRVTALSTAMDRAMKADVAVYGEAALKAKGHYGALRNLPDLDPCFVELLDNNPAYTLIDEILPKDYILQTYDGLILAPGEGRYPWDFHTDLEALNGLGLADDKVLAVNVLYYLDETTPENGATYIVPNSHRSRIVAPRPSLFEECAIPAVGQPGDILIFDSRLWHCAGNNDTAASRRLIKTLYCLPWIRPAMDYRSALSGGKWEALSDKVKTLLGADARVPTSVAEFRGMEAI